MPYLFDTDVLSSVIASRPNIVVTRRMGALTPEDRATSAVSLGELLLGAIRRDRPGLLERIEALVERTAILPFDHGAARIYGSLKADLERAGTPMSEPDLRIASTALAYELTLVTGNERHFRRVPGLNVENWLA